MMMEELIIFFSMVVIKDILMVNLKMQINGFGIQAVKILIK